MGRKSQLIQRTRFDLANAFLGDPKVGADFLAGILDGLEQLEVRTRDGASFPLGYAGTTADGFDRHAAYGPPYRDRGATGSGGGWTRDYHALDQVEVVAKTNVGTFVLGNVEPSWR